MSRGSSRSRVLMIAWAPSDSRCARSPSAWAAMRLGIYTHLFDEDLDALSVALDLVMPK